MVVELDVDGDVFSLRGDGRLRVSDGAADTAGVRIVTSRDAILDLLDARVGLGEAVEAGRVCVRGSLDDVQRAHDSLLAYVHAAVRAPSQPGAAVRTAGGDSHERVHIDAGILRTASHGGGPRGRHRRPHRRARTRGARLRRHGVRGLDTMSATGWGPSRQGRTRPSSSAASPPRSTRRSVRAAEAKPSCVPSRADGASRAPLRERLRANMASASSRRTTYTSGTCSSASRSTDSRRRPAARPLGADLTHGL